MVLELEEPTGHANTDIPVMYSLSGGEAVQVASAKALSNTDESSS